MTLFVNACVGNHSRTEQIARAYLEGTEDITEIDLNELYIEPLDAESLQCRTEYVQRESFSHSYFEHARLFALADEIVIAAPFWDLSFPAKLRIYLENICVTGLTFRYNDRGIPVGLCRAKTLTYITTSGGSYFPDFSYNYIRSLAQNFFGISQTNLIYAENLDIAGNNPEAIVADCIRHCCKKLPVA